MVNLRIENNYNVQRVISSYYNAQVRKSKDLPAANGGGHKDSVTISSEGQFLHKAMQTLKSVPDVREDVVARLKQSIEAGKYTVDAGKIAGMIIDRKA
ncbi:flagellar biosynthesis anti-sigma factor FlgM [Caldanaerobius polysaccharolyticus]|uniref:flagellar biosynthesis anti-sigma factor FlgM n=1 Tax=Caldanaerobius polysaccharolyticus TaxID=44256 RepID=UPI00069151D0|nr:flagellar biosynthesis anti-sigma factor FlgM [Caldanaerobius polysaccharolyticus]